MVRIRAGFGALATSRELKRQVEDKDVEIQDLKRENEELKRENEELKRCTVAAADAHEAEDLGTETDPGQKRSRIQTSHPNMTDSTGVSFAHNPAHPRKKTNEDWKSKEK